MELDAIRLSIASVVLVLNGILISTCQLLCIFVIAVGIIRALVIYLSDSLLKPQTPESFQQSRLAMGYAFSLRLSFLIGSTIMKTMVSSQWEDLARLVVIIAVRTVLNLLLERVIAQTQSQSVLNGVAASDAMEPVLSPAISSPSVLQKE